MLSYGRQSIGEEDIAAVVAAMRSDFLTQGPAIADFEAAFARRVGARHAVAVNSATAALHLALRVAGIGAGDRVVTSPITFLASANAAAYVGAVPDFADIDPVTYTLDPDALSATWRDDTRAVVAVDYAGQACDLPAISRIARARGALVIEDACHATGGRFHGADGNAGPWNIGSNRWADIGVFSFHPVKTMTTGEGGMLVTDNPEWAERARCLRSHGMVRDASRFESENPFPGEVGPWVYQMQDLGYNYRMCDIQAALGLSQLRRLDAFIQRRQQIVRRYNAAFAGVPWLQTPGLRDQRDAATTSWHLYTVLIDFAALGQSRTEVIERLRSEGIGTQVLYIPVYLQPWYRATYGYGRGKCPRAEQFYAGALSLPLFPAMSDHEVERVIAAVLALKSVSTLP